MKREKTKIYTPKSKALSNQKAGGELANESEAAVCDVKKWVDDNEK